MSRRAKIRCASYLAAFCVVMISALGACHVGAGEFETRIDAQFSRCFGETLNAVDRLDRSLRKCAFASGNGMKTVLCAEIYSDAQSVQTSLSMLPVQLDALEKISGQIAVLGDYAFSLASIEAEGITFSDEEIQQFSSFTDMTQNLRTKLETLRQAFEGNTLVHEQRLRLTDSMNNLEEQSAAGTETLDEAFHRMQDEIPLLSPFHYDGKYNERAEASDTEPPVSQAQALQAAATFLKIAPNRLVPLDASEGDFPCWRFSVDASPTGVISVSVHGGYVVRYLADTHEPNEKYDREASVKACSAFLKSHGYQNMVVDQTSPEADNHTICFVSDQNGVLCLPDRIALQINPSSGELLSFNAEEYVKHHHDRQFPEVDADSMRSFLPENALVLGTKTVLIMSPGGTECLCEEFLCQMKNGESASVFVNTETGEQMRIMLEGETEVNQF